MKLTASRSIAISIVALLVTSAAHGRTRPRYGDAVRVEMSASAPSYEGAPDLLAGLVFENLVAVDNNGRLTPGLALIWSSSNNGNTWNFVLRSGVQFHDGSPLTPLAAATALSKTGIPGCTFRQGGNLVQIECDTAQPNLPAMLSQPHYLIYSTTSSGAAVGTGPFRLSTRDNDRFSLKSNDDYWGGRPFLDGIELRTDRNARDQVNDFSLEQTDAIGLPVDQLRRAQQDRVRTDSSRAAETIYLVVDPSKPDLRDTRLRQAISLAIDRAAIHNVIFQRQGEVAGGMLPNWMTGYGFLFPAAQDLVRARQLRGEVGSTPPITIAYDAADPVERLIAERIALNVRDIGINMQAISTGRSADLRLKRVSIPSSDPAIALNGLFKLLNLTPPVNSPTLQSLYKSERAALETYSAIPLVHLPKITAMKDRVHNWTTTPIGSWQLDDVWVSPRAGNREGRP